MEKRDKIKDLAFKRLTALGFTAVDNDLLDIVLDETVEKLLANLNQFEVPDGLVSTVGGMVAGAYILDILASSGTAADSGLNLESGVSSLTEGDISVSFSGSASDADTLKETATRLTTLDKAVLARFRRLV